MPDDHPPAVEGKTSVGAKETSPAAKAEVVSLDQEAKRVGLSVEDQIKLDDQRLRKWMVNRFVWTVIAGDVLTLAALGGLSWWDQVNLEHALIKPGDRIVTASVIMALLGATTIQVGAIAVIIARYLFPNQLGKDV